MKKIAQSILDLIGETPILKLNNYAKQLSLDATILAKLESFNPGGSVKDRTALSMIDDAEKKGVLKVGGTIIEPTSGNTGIALSMIAAARGYKVILTMPDTMSVERRRLVEAYGAKVVLTPGEQGMKGAIERAVQLHEATPGSFIPSQFENPANPSIHENTTGHEIWRQTDGHIDYFIAGVGTGGTVSGIGRYLKKCNPAIKIIAVEPADSPVLQGGKPGPHKIQGIGAGFVPAVYDNSVVDTVMSVTFPDAIDAARVLAKTEGALAGFSGGAALFAATQLARRDDTKGKNIVVLIPDTGERYLSTDLFEG